MPEPVRNALVWAGAVICPAVRADLLFRDLSGSRCNGVCGPDAAWWGSCSAMRCCPPISNVAICHSAFLKSTPGSVSVLCSPLFLFCFVLIEESYFLCNEPFIDYVCFAVVTKLYCTAFYSVRKGRRTGITSRTGTTSRHIHVSHYEPTTTGTDDHPCHQWRTFLATHRLAGRR